MERLTEEKQIGPFAALKDKAESVPGAFGSYDCLYAHMVAVTRLKEYEDTGPIDRFRELARAEQDGRLVVLPFVAMVEQSLQNGKMLPKQDQRFNGRYSVVYVDKKKWPSPLIDICGTHYNREEAEKRLAELTREEAEAALKKR